MPILGSADSAANQDMISKIWTNGDTVTGFFLQFSVEGI